MIFSDGELMFVPKTLEVSGNKIIVNGTNEISKGRFKNQLTPVDYEAKEWWNKTFHFKEVGRKEEEVNNAD